MRADRIFRIPDVDGRFDHGNGLLGILGAANATDEFFGLAAEHTADNNLDPSNILWTALGVHVGGLTGNARAFHALDFSLPNEKST